MSRKQAYKGVKMNHRDNIMRRKITPLLIFASFALTGCGVTGTLKTPPPLFGDKTPIPGKHLDEDAETISGDLTEENRELREALDDLER